MGRLPSHIFIVRHGNRLDAADKQWHLTSPTPYDPPLTYGGFLQARLVGNQIGSMLEQAKVDAEVTKNGAALSGKRKRFKIVIHSSPFLRCVQTSVGISSGLAQSPFDSIFHPSDVIVSRSAPNSPQTQFKSALLRLDPFLGEWLSPEYFEMITPPPGPALMIGGAKAELLRREDYSMYTDWAAATNNNLIPTGALWNALPTSTTANTAQSLSSESDVMFGTSALAAALATVPLEKKGYLPPKPMYAVSSSGKIPEGLVAHARDSCIMVDYQWDSMRDPLDFGDGGKFGEEWTDMHQRFRRGLKKLVNWYVATDNPDELMPSRRENSHDDYEEEEVETVIIIVSHGAGCNALIGAVTHQPVLMDVGIASISVAVRKPESDQFKAILATTSTSHDPVSIHEAYDIRLSASTEHLRSNSGTPVSTRPTSTANIWSPGRRGRTSTFSSTTGGPVLTPFTYLEPFSAIGSRSSSASATVGTTAFRRDSGSSRRSPRVSGLSIAGNGYPASNTPPSGLWAPAPSSLRLMDDGDNEEAVDDFDNLLPDFDNKRFQPAIEDEAKGDTSTEPFPNMAPAVQPPSILEPPTSSTPPKGPVFAAPIKIHTDFGLGSPAEEVPLPQLGGGLGGLWGLPIPPGEAERFRDLSHTKRRWTVNERAS